MDNNQSTSNVSLDNLDLFSLLHLDHLTDEEKVNYANELAEVAMGAVISDDLPLYLSPEELTQLNTLLSQNETQAQALELLKTKVPQFPEILKDKVLSLKKSLVQANVSQRLELNKEHKQQVRNEEESPENGTELLKLEEERTNLEKTLEAITHDEWTTVSRLISATK